jgi:hypothetical protein
MVPSRSMFHGCQRFIEQLLLLAFDLLHATHVLSVTSLEIRNMRPGSTFKPGAWKYEIEQN